VLVLNGQAHLIRKRDTLDDLLRNQVAIEIWNASTTCKKNHLINTVVYQPTARNEFHSEMRSESSPREKNWMSCRFLKKEKEGTNLLKKYPFNWAEKLTIG
jgi:hypothetical protein